MTIEKNGIYFSEKTQDYFLVLNIRFGYLHYFSNITREFYTTTYLNFINLLMPLVKVTAIPRQDHEIHNIKPNGR